MRPTATLEIIRYVIGVLRLGPELKRLHEHEGREPHRRVDRRRERRPLLPVERDRRAAGHPRVMHAGEERPPVHRRAVGVARGVVVLVELDARRIERPDRADHARVRRREIRERKIPRQSVGRPELTPHPVARQHLGGLPHRLFARRVHRGNDTRSR